MQPKLPSFIFFLLLSLYPAFSKKCNPNDMKKLLEIKAHFDANYMAFDDWDPKTACCNWWGLQCNPHGRVVSLHLQLDPDVEYGIPSALGYLPYLESLSMVLYGKLAGPIPESFARLTNLKTLGLSVNNLSGPIPAFLGRLTKLSKLDLSNNAFTGPIPASLGQLTQLTNLDLSLNKITGPIPATLGQLTSLTDLDLFYNLLSGPIPTSLSHLTKLKNFDLSSNHLTGSIPASFGSFNNPEMYINLGSNRLSGPIPRSVGEAHVSGLDLSHNKFTGDASFFLGRNKKALETLYLNNNLFHFDFSKVEFPIGLRNFAIGNNRIYGSLPKQLGQLPLKFLDVSHNLLCGPIPTGRRIKHFSPDNFEHNKCLCGLPLPPCI